MNTLHMTRRFVLATLLGVASTVGAMSADEGIDQAGKLRAQLADRYPQLEVDSIRPTPIEGLFEVVSGTKVHYLSADGRYLLRGSLIDLQEERDLTTERRDGLVHEAVETVSEDRMVIFEPEQGAAEHTITVFTDTSCQYCQRLHEDLLNLMEEDPVRVRYLLYPRAGPGSPAADTLRDVWCAPDPQAAMTAAKRNEEVPARAEDCATPLAQHYQLGQRIGITGTPYVVIGDDGPVVPGYRPPRRMRSLLGIDQ